MSIFSERLSRSIKQRGIKKAVLAGQVGITPGTLSRYLGGKMQPEQPVLLLLAQQLGVSVQYLMGHDTTNESVSERPMVYEIEQRYSPETVSLVGLNEEERRTVLRMLDALRSGEADVRQHLIGQLKIIELALQSRRRQPRTEEGRGA